MTVAIHEHEAPSHTAHSGIPHTHVVSPAILLTVYFALVLLTFLTVGVTYVDLGDLNIWIALGVAVLKATLVVLYFMHLRWDRPFNAIVLISALVFIAIFIGAAMMDSANYQVNLEPPGAHVHP